MPCSFMAFRWSSRSRRARIPPWTFGCRVFTRPSIISGKPVYSPTSVTTIPFSLRSWAVPPVDRIWTPWESSALANSTTPVLSETLISARRILTRSLKAVLFELFSQRVAVETEELGGARLVALRLAHHHLEHRLLDGGDHHVVDA